MKHRHRLQCGQPRKHSAEKPETRGHTLWGSIYVKCPEQVNPETEHRLVAARGWGRRRDPGGWKHAGTRRRRWPHNAGKALSATEWFTLKRPGLRYASSTSVSYFCLKGKPQLDIFEEFNKPTLKHMEQRSQNS